jgi:hypothetical protein
MMMPKLRREQGAQCDAQQNPRKRNAPQGSELLAINIGGEAAG